MRKAERYQILHRRIQQRLEQEGLAGRAAVEAAVAELHADSACGLSTFWWCGVYRVRDAPPGRELELVAGSSPACSPLPVAPRTGGVCSDCVLIEKAILVPEVSRYPGHVYCDDRARSEVVVPIVAPGGRLCGVLDVDDLQPGSFDWDDVAGLDPVARLLAPHLGSFL